MDKETNYYLSLGLPLDPPVRDKASIEAAIQKKLTEWNQGVNNPTKGLLFKSLAAKVPEIKKALLSNDATRDAVIDEALKIVKGQVATLLEALGKSGSMTEAQVKEVCKKVPQFSEKTIRKMIKVPIVERAGPVFNEPKKPADPPIKPTDNMQMDKFQKNLVVLKKKDIYDFLGCSRTSSPATICTLADAELGKALKAPLKTPEVSASQELAGLITSYFKKDGAKEAYDLALKTYIGQKKLTEIFAIRCISKTIDWKAYQASIADCRAIGMSQEEAEYFVYDFYCNKRKCPPPTIPEGEKPRSAIHYCRACFAPNPEDAAVCQSCGTPFKVKCPKCGQTVELDSSFCPKCSFPIGDMPMAQTLVKKAQDDLAKNDIVQAMAKVDRALEYWPKMADAITLQSAITKRKQELVDIGNGVKAKEEAAKAEAERQTAINKFNDAIREGRFDDAEGLFPGLASKGVVDKDLEALKGKLAFARFDAALAEFRFDDASRLIGDVVRYGVDTEANLKARVKTVKDGKLLFVKASFSEALSKGEIAKAESLLLSFKKSGCPEREAVQMQKSIDEKKKEIAEERANELVGKLEKVESLTAVASEEGAPEVQISWEPAKTGTPASGWMVKRASSEGEVELEKFTTRTRYIDKTAKLGVEYSYIVIPVVTVDSGKKDARANEDAAVRSKPVVCLTRLAPDAVKGKGQGEQGLWGIATLSWELPPNINAKSGEVTLLLSRTDGKIRNEDVTDRCGRFEDKSVSVGQSYEYTLSMVMAGKPCGTSSVNVQIVQMRQPEPVQQLSAERLPNGRWLVNWTWPTGMEQAIVSPVFDDVVRDGVRLESSEGARSVSLDIYKSDNGVEVFLPAAAHGIAVCTFMDRPGGGRIYSKVETVSAVAKQTVVYYGFIQKSGGLFRKAHPPEAVIWSDSAALPDLVLVEGLGGRPVRKDAGTIVETIPAQRSSLPTRIVLRESARTDCMKLFLSNSERDADMFRIALPVTVLPKSLLR